MIRLQFLCYLVLLACLTTVSSALAETPEWSQFLGPQRNGISSETGLIDAIPTGGPKVVWRVAGGEGMSGIAISSNRAFTLLQDRQQQYVVALDTQNGKTLWKTAVAPAYSNAMGNGPRGTPAVVGNTVFVFTGQGLLLALEVASGEIKWTCDPLSELGGRAAEYGMACSPLVHNGRVIVTVGARRGTVVAVDAKSGQIAWSAGSDSAGYSSPAMLKLAGMEQLVAFTGVSALGIQPASGKVLWRYPFKTNYECNIATPIAINGDVFLSAGENHGSVRLKLSPKPDGTFTPSEVWSSFGPRSVMRNEWQTSALIDGYLYGMDNVGGAGPITHLKCVNAANGELAWQQLRFGKGNFIVADGKLFVVTFEGEFVLVAVKPTGFAELGRSQVCESTRQAPALYKGRLYLRDSREIICLDVAQ